MRSKVFLCLLLGCFLAGCGRGAEERTRAGLYGTDMLAPTDAIDTAPVEIRVLYRGEKFPRGSDPVVWWALDSKTLFFRANKAIWEYDLVGGSRRLVPGFRWSTLTPKAFLVSPPTTISTSISPSGRRAIYLVPVPATATTWVNPSMPVGVTEESGKNQQGPDGIGEGEWKPGVVELWYWEQDSVRKIGEVENCVQDYIWSRDEKIVVAIASPLPMVCRESYAWLVDLQFFRIVSLFPKDQFDSQVTVAGISPDTRYVLYYRGDDVYVRDRDLEDRELNIPAGAAVQWIDNSQVLVLYDDTLGCSVLGVYNLETGTQEDFFFFRNFPEICDMTPIVWTISPNGEWLALTMGHDIYYIEEIWLIRLKTDDA